MKKILLSIAAVLLVALVFSSCRSHEECPAYNMAPTETEANA
jgi:PBP1b-binding outer membrane lipoprotein LpoB